MSLLFSKQVSPESAYAVWNITETIYQLKKGFDEEIPDAIQGKQSEWIVTRLLVRHLCKVFNLDYEGIAYLPTGKPILRLENAQISITHSFPYAAALIHLEKSCGIDMELPRDKMRFVKSKFLHEEELRKEPHDLETLCKIWSAKEVLYKIYSKRALSLKEDMLVQFLSPNLINGSILKEEEEFHFEIQVEKVNQYFLVYGF